MSVPDRIFCINIGRIPKVHLKRGSRSERFWMHLLPVTLWSLRYFTTRVRKKIYIDIYKISQWIRSCHGFWGFRNLDNFLFTDCICRISDMKYEPFMFSAIFKLPSLSGLSWDAGNKKDKNKGADKENSRRLYNGGITSSFFLCKSALTMISFVTLQHK